VERWTTDLIGDQKGRVAVVTGASTGIGYETALALGRAGASVVLACRDTGRGEAAAARIRDAAPGTPTDVVRLDLASLESVRTAAADLTGRYPRIDLLINNAGRMWTPRADTEDGFESQFGVNHLGHFALTGLVLPSLVGVPGSRVVTLASSAHTREQHLDLSDLDWRRRPYRPLRAYAQSKLANVLFAYDLQDRLVAAGAPTISLAVHPGGVRTELTRYMNPALRVVGNVIMRASGQPTVAAGALSTLRAATDPGLRGGEYVQPAGRRGDAGDPVVARSSPRTYDPRLRRELWAASERLTGVRYPLAGSAA
jgi:NAD(P)-dependent dehydrogenase (short-subunit alcohol dehydrogenase family)